MKRYGITKVFAILMVCILVAGLAGCKSNSGNTESPKATDVPKTNEEVATTATPSPTEIPAVTAEPVQEPEINNEPTEEPDDNKEPDIIGTGKAVEPIAITIAAIGDYGEDTHLTYKGEVVATARYDIPYISEEDSEKYPNLASAIEQIREDFKTLADSELEFAYELACGDIDEGREIEGPYTTEYYITVCRADSEIVSLLVSNYSWMGGVHPNYYDFSFNIDVQTGQQVCLSNIINPEFYENDAAAFVELIKNNIGQDADSEEFYFDFYQTSLVENTAVWTISEQGLTMHINPYDIASYAAGSFVANFTFKSFPELFNGKYTDTPDSYMVGANGSYINFDLDNDGNIEHIVVYPDNVNEYYVDSLEVMVWDNYYSHYYSETVPASGFFDDFSVVLAHMGENVNYLYYCFSIENDLRSIYVYKIDADSVECVGMKGLMYFDSVSGDIYYSYNVVDPDSFSGVSRHDFFGTTFEKATYHIGENGIPEIADKYYEFLGEWDITSLTDYEFEIIDEESDTVLGTEILPAGTVMQMYRADGEGAVDFIGSDGRIYRIIIDKTTYDDIEDYVYYGYINGVRIEELFDGINYAG